MFTTKINFDEHLIFRMYFFFDLHQQPVIVHCWTYLPCFEKEKIALIFTIDTWENPCVGQKKNDVADK